MGISYKYICLKFHQLMSVMTYELCVMYIIYLYNHYKSHSDSIS